jgi:hypothetical protein
LWDFGYAAVQKAMARLERKTTSWYLDLKIILEGEAYNLHRADVTHKIFETRGELKLPKALTHP